MPQGDAQRTWFPEMVEILKEQWNPSMSWDQLISLRDRLDSILQSIRSDRNILPAMMLCPKCKEYHRSKPPSVSIRAIILALSRFGIADKTMVKELDKAWKKYRKEKELDRYGKIKEEKEKGS